jgi:hypothetical protein
MSHLLRANLTFSTRRFSQRNCDLFRHSDRRNHGFDRVANRTIVGAQIKIQPGQVRKALKRVGGRIKHPALLWTE